MGILPISDVIKKLQINFVNDLINIKKSGMCLEILRKDEEAGGITGLLQEVRDYCKEYNIPDVTKEYVHPNTIKRKVTETAMKQLWTEIIQNPAIPWCKRKYDLKNPEYDQEAKMIAKLSLCWATGAMNFKKSRRHEYMKAHGNLDCLVPGCCQEDSLDHVQTCYGYTVRPKEDGNHEDWREYLTKLETERIKKFGARYSLLNFKKVI